MREFSCPAEGAGERPLIVAQVRDALVRVVGAAASVAVAQKISIDEDEFIQPDLCVFWRSRRRLLSEEPTIHDVLLAIDVSGVSASADRAANIARYAAHVVPEVWLLNMRRYRLESYRLPVAGEYAEYGEFDYRSRIRLVALPAAEVAMSEIMDPARYVFSVQEMLLS